MSHVFELIILSVQRLLLHYQFFGYSKNDGGEVVLA